jgi:hypothetical protein
VKHSGWLSDLAEALAGKRDDGRGGHLARDEHSLSQGSSSSVAAGPAIVKPASKLLRRVESRVPV